METFQPGLARAHAPRRKGLVALAAVGVAFLVQSLLSDWLRVKIFATPIKSQLTYEGIGAFGGFSVAFGMGLGVLAMLVWLALWRPGRWPTVLSVATLAVAALLAVDACLILLAFGEEQSQAASTVFQLRESVRETTGGLPASVGFEAESRGLYLGLLATFVFALAAGQVAWPEHSVRAQVAAGALSGAIAMSLPWTRVWLVDDNRPHLQVQSLDRWLWSLGFEGAVLMVEFLLLVGLACGCLRAPSYARERWALGSCLLAAWVFLSALVADTNSQLDAMLVSEQASEVFSVWATGADVVLAGGAALLGLAAARAWWHGREEPLPPSTDDQRWLPEPMWQSAGS